MTRILNSDLVYQSSIPRLTGDDERFVVLAMHQLLLERGLCQREHTDEGPLLIFPSYYRRERPDLVGHPAVLVSYRFSGFLDDIYATLVVQLHHTKSFQQHQLWRYAADFKTLTNKTLGIKMIRRAEGAGEIEVYFDSGITIAEKIIFSKYVHEHLLQRAEEVERLRHYVCQKCGTPVGNREVAMERLHSWLSTGKRGKKPTIICSRCEKRVSLWDDMEEYFARSEIRDRVRRLQDESMIVLGKESYERSLAGEIISTVSIAGQVCRELMSPGIPIDMEVEFTSDAVGATRRKVYLQIKVDTYYRKEERVAPGPVSQLTNGRVLRRSRFDAEDGWENHDDDDDEDDGADEQQSGNEGSGNRRTAGNREVIFAIRDQRHIRHLMELKSPIILLVRNERGAINWMDITSEVASGSSNNLELVFKGQRFDVMSVWRWRDMALKA